MKALLYIGGRKHRWAVVSRMSREQLEAMRYDGICIYEVVGSAPAWMPVWLGHQWMRCKRALAWLTQTD